MDVTIHSIGMNRGAPRLWLEGNMLARSGFSPRTRYEVIRIENGLMFKASPTGRRGVVEKVKREKSIPVIDLNSAEALSAFEGLEHVRVVYKTGEIYILPEASELRARERVARVAAKLRAGEPLQLGSLAHGMGVMDDATAAGFARAGIASELKFANEIRADLLDHAINVGRTFTGKTIALQGKMQEFAFDEYVMRAIGQCDHLSAGMPCSGASLAGRAKRKLAHAESHIEVGHLVVAFIAVVARTNPVSWSLENVVPYLSSASMDIIYGMMKDLGYDVHVSIESGADWNALENRKRGVIVGVTKGIKFSFDDIERPTKIERKLADILEDVALDDPRWKPMNGLKEKAVRDAAAGKNFAMQIFTADDTSIGTLTKGISKNRSTDCKLQHPVNPDLLRLPTPLEHAAAKSIPVALLGNVGDLSDTIAHEGLGQSVIYPKIEGVSYHLAKSLNAMLIEAEEEPFMLAAA